jgi:hypothetical protein
MSRQYRDILTGLFERLIRKPRLPDLKCMPLGWIDLLVDINHIERLVHPQLMNVLPNENSPVLCWVWIFADILCDHLPQTRFLGEPFAAHPGNRMPAYLNSAKVCIDTSLAKGYDVGFCAESEGVLECKFAFEQFVFAQYFAL